MGGHANKDLQTSSCNLSKNKAEGMTLQPTISDSDVKIIFGNTKPATVGGIGGAGHMPDHVHWELSFVV